MGLWPWRSKRDRATARYHVKHENSVRREFATTTLPVVSAWTSPIYWLARVHRARRRSRGNPASRHAFSHRLRCRPFGAEFDPSSFLPVVPRLDRATAPHCGRGWGRAHQALLRSRLDRKDEAEPRGNHHRVGKTRLPGNLKDRRSRCKGCSRIARAI